jgi:hypothetical protein
MGVSNRITNSNTVPDSVPVITTVASDELTGETALASLTDGILKHASGTPATATAGTDYFKPAGVAGGQSAVGGTASGENLSLSSTGHATKGKINLGSASTYDEVNDRLGLGQTTPTVRLHVKRTDTTGTVAFFENTTSTVGAQLGVGR